MNNENLLTVIQKSFANVSVNLINAGLLIGEFEVDLPDFDEKIRIKLWENKDLKYFITVNLHPNQGENFKVSEYTTCNAPEGAIEKLAALYTNYEDKEFIRFRDF